MSDVADAIGASNLGRLPAEIIGRLLAEARRVTVPAGATVHHAGEAQPHLELVVAGLVRVYVSAAGGRTMTVRYCRRGGLIGAATLYAPGYVRPFGIQALSDADLLVLRPERLRAMADTDPRVAAALLAETSERVLAFVAELSGSAFRSVRAKVAAHLLDLASEHQSGADLVAHVTQQELADAVGTAREVVVRTLRELRSEDVVGTGRGGIRIIRPERLLEESGTQVPDGNPGTAGRYPYWRVPKQERR